MQRTNDPAIINRAVLPGHRHKIVIRSGNYAGIGQTINSAEVINTAVAGNGSGFRVRQIKNMAVIFDGAGIIHPHIKIIQRILNRAAVNKIIHDARRTQFDDAAIMVLIDALDNAVIFKRTGRTVNLNHIHTKGQIIIANISDQALVGECSDRHPLLKC
ncbi:hypothetical protein D3C81_1516060 [compost metagenome]